MDVKQNSKNFESKQIKPIIKLKTGKCARVVDIKSNDSEVVEKLESMGIRAGIVLKKISASLFHGPIILEKDFNQIAIGYDLAKKISVEFLDQELS